MAQQAQTKAHPPQSKKPPRLLVDGKEVKGHDLTRADFERAEHVVDRSVTSGDEEIVFGFTTVPKLELWIGRQTKKEQQGYHFLRGQVDSTRKEADVSKAEQKAIAKLQLDKARYNSAVVDSLIKFSGVDPDDEDKVDEVLRTSDPLYGHHSVYMYQFANYAGMRLVLGTGAYPKFEWFDNKCTSYKNFSGCWVRYQYSWFRGKSYTLLTDRKVRDLGWWDNKISSSAYGSYWDMLAFVASH